MAKHKKVNNRKSITIQVNAGKKLPDIIEQKQPMPNDYGLYNIDNKLIYGKGRKVHLYAIYFNKNGTVNKAVETTHIYEKEKEEKIRKGFLKVEQFGGMHFPTGVNNNYYKKDIKNRHLTKTTQGITPSTFTMTEAQARRIYDFAKEERK